jgi:hypothetical protein
MTTVQPQKTSTLDYVVKYWVVWVFIFGSIAAWVTLNGKVDAHTNDIQSLKSADVSSGVVNNQILVELSAIRTDLLWLKNNLR